MRAIVMSLGCFLAVAALAGCAEDIYRESRLLDQRVDSAAAVVPTDAELVAGAYNRQVPLLFEATEPGRVYYIAGDKLVASFGVQAGDEVTFEPADLRQDRTRLRVNQQTRYAFDQPHQDNRLYFK
jgi:hypothetical protein